MNPATLFLLIGSVYLLIIAYGVVRTRKKGLPPHLRFLSATAQVVLPPVVIFAALALTSTPSALAGWSVMLAMLAVAGALLALCTDQVARRVL